MTNQKLMTKSEFARYCKCAPTSIANASKKSLIGAVVGKRIDANHPDAVAYRDRSIERWEQRQENVEGQKETKRGWNAINEQKDDVDVDVPDDIAEILDWTVYEVFKKFGSKTRFNDWLRAVKMIAEIDEKWIRSAEKKGTLVSRKLILEHVLAPVNSVHVKLMTDGAKTITRRVVTMHDAGRSKVEIEEFVASQIGSFIKPLKAKISRSMKKA